MIVKMYPCCGECGTIIQNITIIKNSVLSSVIYSPSCCPKCKAVIEDVDTSDIKEKEECK